MSSNSTAQASRSSTCTDKERPWSDPDRNSEVFSALSDAGIDIALRNRNLRFSPHLYNTGDEIDRAVSVLNAFS
ncbi:MAG TPA: hypothetical protein VFA89_12380 [Terriglobales bacterium]|nr:hypothetical protein [Terriglobales bacterium]